MATRIGFLRAVNVGRRTVRMTQVVTTCTALGYEDVWTFANSGNVVFRASGGRAPIERAIGSALADAVGFEVTTFVRSAAELRAALRLAPFEVGDGDTYFITFLREPPAPAAAAALEATSNHFDTLHVHGRDVHWLMHGKSTETTVPAAAWRKLGENASTSRNVTMLRKLAAKLDG